eukprot:sb/3477895/
MVDKSSRTVYKVQMRHGAFLNQLFKTNPTQPELAFYLIGKLIQKSSVPHLDLIHRPTITLLFVDFLSQNKAPISLLPVALLDNQCCYYFFLTIFFYSSVLVKHS